MARFTPGTLMSPGQVVKRTIQTTCKARRVSAAKPKKSIDKEEASIARRLRDSRDAHNVTAKALAEKAGVDAPAYSKFENGLRGLESGRLLRVLAAAADLGLDVQDYILRGIGAPGRKLGPVLTVAATPELARELLKLLPQGALPPVDETPRPRRKK
jgi:transcriptional regulator with XRE-family HTH domain